MSLKDVLKQRRSEIFKIADQYGVHNIRIFGSVGKETERPDSDVDFLVDLEKGRSLLDLGGLVFDLQQRNIATASTPLTPLSSEVMENPSLFLSKIGRCPYLFPDAREDVVTVRRNSR